MKHKCSQHRQGNVVKRGFVAHCCHLQNNKLDDTKSNNSVKNIIFFFVFFLCVPHLSHNFLCRAWSTRYHIKDYCLLLLCGISNYLQFEKFFHNYSRYSQILNCLRTGLSAVYQHFNVSSELIVLKQMPLNLQLLNS